MTSSADRQEKVKRRSDMACTNCRARKLKCENRDSIPPCKRCEHDHKPDCQFVSVAEDKSRVTSEPEHKFTSQFTHSLASVPSSRSQNSSVSAAPSNAYRQAQSRPPDYLYQPSYDAGHWSSQSQGQYVMQSNSRLPYPQPTGAGLAPSAYPFAQPSSSSYVQHSFTSDAHTPVIPQNMYYPVNTLQEASQGGHSTPSYYPRNEQPSGVVYCDPSDVVNVSSAAHTNTLSNTRSTNLTPHSVTYIFYSTGSGVVIDGSFFSVFWLIQFLFCAMLPDPEYNSILYAQYCSRSTRSCVTSCGGGSSGNNQKPGQTARSFILNPWANIHANSREPE